MLGQDYLIKRGRGTRTPTISTWADGDFRMDGRAIGIPTCSLCGQPIAPNPDNDGDSLSMDHVPPKQFYPREIRASANPNLWLVPTHGRCNADYREDEEYFYHAVYPLVQNANRAMGQVVHRDLKRRTSKPQTPAMARSLLKEFGTVTEGGILLPPGIVQFKLDVYRVQRVAIKIAQGLFYLDDGQHVPRENCKDIRLCESANQVPELYKLLGGAAEAKSVVPSVFSYWRSEFDDLHLFSMLFWEAFMFCAAFKSPSATSSKCVADATRANEISRGNDN